MLFKECFQVHFIIIAIHRYKYVLFMNMSAIFLVKIALLRLCILFQNYTSYIFTLKSVFTHDDDDDSNNCTI